MIFVSSPYSSDDAKLVQWRYEFVAKYTANLVASGKIAFSPIVYGHTLLNFASMPSDWEFWKNFCESFLTTSKEVHVLMLPGWDLSSGVKAEIEYANSKGIPVNFIAL